MLFFIFLECENPPEIYEGEPNIFCILRTDKDTTIALVGTSVKLMDTINNPSQWNGVSGASVKISYGDDEVNLRELKDSIGFYITDSLKVEARKTYSLEVNYPDGKIAKGTTTVPDSLKIFSVKIDTIVEVDTFFGTGDTWTMFKIKLKWEKNKNTKGYSVDWESYYKSERDSFRIRSPLFPPFEVDSVFRWFGEMMVQPRDSMNLDTLKLAEVKIQVWGLDDNYYDYFSSQQMWPGEPINVPGHLDGGLGVFGSAYITERRISFLP